MEYFVEDTKNNEEKEEDSETMKNAKGYARGLLIAAGAREKSSEELDLEKIKEQEKKEISREKAAYAKEIRQKTIQSAKKYKVL